MATPDSRVPSPIMQILNVFAPANGANVGQLVSRADGSHQIFGDSGLVQAGLRRLGLTFSGIRLVMLSAPEPSPKARKTRNSAKTAAAAE